jgi:hypothetical protein
MESLAEARLRELLVRAHIDVAAASAGVGRELTHRAGPRRVIVIHLADSDSQEYRVELMSRVLALDEEWVLLTRYGSVADLGVMTGAEGAAGFVYQAHERTLLAAYLCSRSTALSSVSADLYVLGCGGDALLTWDHHSADEGISVAFQSAATAGRLLVSLNELGAELEVFTNG